MSQSIRFIFGRPRGDRQDALQSIEFHRGEWTFSKAAAWLQRNGYPSRDLTKQGQWLRHVVRSRSVFVPRTLRAVETGRQEHVTMSNPKRKKKSRPVKNARRSKKRAAPKKAKVSRTTVKTVKVMHSNPKKKRAKKRRARAPKRNARPQASQFTVTLSPSAARSFAKVARISKKLRREMLRSLRRHPSGGVYVAQAAWHGTRDQAKRLADRVQLVLAYAAGRRRSALTSSSVPRVVAVP